MVHIYPWVLQALAGRGYAGRLEGWIAGVSGVNMQDPANELPRIPIPRTWVNKPLRDSSQIHPPMFN
jgi:hypothetical protein